MIIIFTASSQGIFPRNYSEKSLRESRSFDHLPMSLRNRFSGSLENIPILDQYVKGGGDVAIISGNPNGLETVDKETTNLLIENNLKNNCNGSVAPSSDVVPPLNCDAYSPLLLQRQASLTSPPDEINLESKRWHSLECGMEDSANLLSKKLVGGKKFSGSAKKSGGGVGIASWLVNLLQVGNNGTSTTADNSKDVDILTVPNNTKILPAGDKSESVV